MANSCKNVSDAAGSIADYQCLSLKYRPLSSEQLVMKGMKGTELYLVRAVLLSLRPNFTAYPTSTPLYVNSEPVTV